MVSENEKYIKQSIRNENFSYLSFLDDIWCTSENRAYIGFYYFILSLKNENNEHVLNEIIDREGSLSNAYLYLGLTANDLYDIHNSNHIALSFFRKSIEEDSENSDAYWHIYRYTYDFKYLIKSLKIDFKQNEIKQCSSKLSYPSIFLEGIEKLPKEDLFFLKEIWRHPDLKEIENIRNTIALVYFFLGEYDLGVEVIKNSNYIDSDVVKKYFDKNLIDFDMSKSKIHYFQSDRFLLDNKEIYNLYKKEAEKGKLNPIKDVMIQKAFLADQFEDVIKYFEDSNPKKHFNDKLKSSLYYLLAQIELDRNIDNKIYEFIKDKFYHLEYPHRDKETYILNLHLKFKLLCLKIENDSLNNFMLKLSIESYSPYREASEILDTPEILTHNSYEDLKKQLLSIKGKIVREQNLVRLNELKNTESDSISNHLDLMGYCSAYIKSKEYDLVIKKILDFHGVDTPSMNSFNYLGICYEYKEDYENAILFYKNALELMYLSKEKNHQIIYNYLKCCEKHSTYKVNKEEYEKLKNEFNLSLVNSFKWNYSCTDRFNTLFKYSPFNINTIDSLVNQYFYLPSKEQLNDPIELPDLDNIDADSLIHKKYYICSFSNNENSMLMWSHYAEQHKGIMVEYWFGGELPNGVGVGKVNYVHDKKRQKEKDNYVFNQFLLTKNKDWDYENEVRIFSFTQNKVEFTAYDYPNPDRSKINAKIRSITLGLQFPENKKKLIGRLVQALNSKLLPDEQKVIVWQAFMSEDNNFALEYKKIELD